MSNQATDQQRAREIAQQVIADLHTEISFGSSRQWAIGVVADALETFRAEPAAPDTARLAELEAERAKWHHWAGGRGPDHPDVLDYNRQQIRIERLEQALRALVTQLDSVHAHPQYLSVWLCAQDRFGPYTGPDYKDALDAARETLGASDVL